MVTFPAGYRTVAHVDVGVLKSKGFVSARDWKAVLSSLGHVGGSERVWHKEMSISKGGEDRLPMEHQPQWEEDKPNTSPML